MHRCFAFFKQEFVYQQISHGRTVHSKVHGLQIFDNVRVDLIAPAPLALPEKYRREMERLNYDVRVFESIEDYLKQDEVAGIW